MLAKVYLNVSFDAINRIKQLIYCFIVLKFGSMIRRVRLKNESQPISRVLSWTTIPLGYASPHTSSNLPGSSAGRTNGSLFGLAPGGVCRAVECYHPRGALLPHPFTLTILLLICFQSLLTCPLTAVMYRSTLLCSRARRLA